MRTFLAVSIFIMIGVSGCIEHRPPEKASASEADMSFPPIKRKVLKGLRVYEGVIPCADCSGIYQRLALKGDTLGIFRLTETYRDATEDGDEIIVTTGSWKRYKVKTNNETQVLLYLSEGSLRDSSRIQRYALMDKKIMQLDLNGDSIESTSDYMLKLIKETK
jgi:copper homeostasis protein (lipoprotein)